MRINALPALIGALLQSSPLQVREEPAYDKSLRSFCSELVQVVHAGNAKPSDWKECYGCAGVSPEDAKLLTMSTLTEQGVMDVKQVACDRLLASRVEAKLQVQSVDLLQSLGSGQGKILPLHI